MDKKNIFSSTFISGALLSIPYRSYAAITDGLTNPIFPEACSCPGTAPDYGCVLQVIQNVTNFGISFAIIIATLWIAFVGFSFITSAANPGAREEGRRRLLGIVVGLFVVLSAWLIVDFIMKTLYKQPTEFGPWNSILGSRGDDVCLDVSEPLALNNDIFTVVKSIPSGIANVFNPGTGSSVGGGFTGGGFTYQSGIEAQKIHASPALSQLLSCMATKIPPGVGQISSISDRNIINGSKTFAQCAAGGHSACNHSVNSCHYGGSKCTGRSYAVDFGDEKNASVLTAAAKTCGATAIYNEGNHIHVSVGGGSSGCGCS